MARKHTRGSRPPRGVKYDPEIADAVCRRIVEGLPLAAIAGVPDMPDRATVRAWLNENADFRAAFDRACVDRAELLAHEILVIADELSRDGEASSVRVQQARLRIDARKWYVATILGKTLSEKPALVPRHEDALDELV